MDLLDQSPRGCLAALLKLSRRRPHRLSPKDIFVSPKDKSMSQSDNTALGNSAIGRLFREGVNRQGEHTWSWVISDDWNGGGKLPSSATVPSLSPADQRPTEVSRKLFEFEIFGKTRDLTNLVAAIVIISSLGLLVWIALTMPMN
jgi:hypothetical protein